MSRFHTIQDPTGVVMKHPTYGITIATLGSETSYNTTTGVPTNGTAGYAIGCLWQNFLGASGSAAYINTGTLASSTWTNIA